MIPAAILLDVLAITGGTVHTLVPGELPGPLTVIVRDGRIEAIGADLAIPADARVRDATGKHVLPGLIDAQVVFDPDHDGLYLAAGVTLVRDMGADVARIIYERKIERRDASPGPAIVTSGTLLDGLPPSIPGAVPLRSADDVDHAIEIMTRGGERPVDVDVIATGPTLGLELWRYVIELAHAHDLDVWSQMPAGCRLEDFLASDVDGLLHIDNLRPAGIGWDRVFPTALAKTAESMGESGIPLVPWLMGTAYRLRSMEIGKDVLPLLDPYVSAIWVGELQAREELLRSDVEGYTSMGRKTLERQLKLLGLLHDAGVQLVPGSMSPWPWLVPGQALHDELALWNRDAGIPADEVLALATREAAEVLGVGDERGTLEAGKLADILIVSADPRDDLGVLRRPEAVVLRGRLLEREDLIDRLVLLERRMDAKRAELATPLVVSDPELPEGDLIASGEVETRMQALRTTAEHWAAVQTGGETRSFVGHLVVRGGGEIPETHIQIRQDFRKGRLESFDVRLSQGENEMVARGLWTANTLRVERRLNGGFVSTDSFPQRPQAVMLGSLTGILALDERPAPGEVLLLELIGTELSPEFQAGVRRDRQDSIQVLSTELGYQAWEYDDNGRFLSWETSLGGRSMITMPTEILALYDRQMAEAQAAAVAEAAAGADAGAEVEAGAGTGDGSGADADEEPADGGVR